MNNKKTSIKDIKITKIKLGEGSFSKVFLAHDKDNINIKYSLKKINIKNLNKDDIENINNEIEIHKTLNNEYIIKLFDFEKRGNKIYLLLEYAENGNLFDLIYSDKYSIIDESKLKKIYKSIILGIKYIHSKNILHRDIKPENILLDNNLNPKICDFGWSIKFNINKPQFSICGTIDYMSPEIYLNKMQNFGSDIWSLGVLLYEMTQKHTLFNNQMKAKKILKYLMKGKYTFNFNTNKNAKLLIQRILKFSQFERPNINEILDHVYFKNSLCSINKSFNQTNLKLFMPSIEAKISNKASIIFNFSKKKRKNNKLEKIKTLKFLKIMNKSKFNNLIISLNNIKISQNSILFENLTV